jgi:hypothetical protein
MDEKKKDRILTASAVILVAAMMIAMAWVMFAYGNNEISMDAMYIATGSISSGMFLVVMVYAVLCFKGKSSTTEQYMELVERKEKEKQQKE